jgi:hypothetical protein
MIHTGIKFQKKRKGTLSMNKLDRICHYGVAVEIVDETLGKLL